MTRNTLCPRISFREIYISFNFRPYFVPFNKVKSSKLPCFQTVLNSLFFKSYYLSKPFKLHNKLTEIIEINIIDGLKIRVWVMYFTLHPIGKKLRCCHKIWFSNPYIWEISQIPRHLGDFPDSYRCFRVGYF